MTATSRTWSLRRALPWILATVFLAAAIHAALLLLIPGMVMERMLALVRPANQIIHAPLVDDTFRRVVYPSPDQLYSVCAFDLSAGPLRVSSLVPKETYWSVSIFDEKTNTIFLGNAEQARNGQVDLILRGKGDQAAPGNARDKAVRLIDMPTQRGLVLFRTLITDQAQFAALDKLRRTAHCATLAR